VFISVVFIVRPLADSTLIDIITCSQWWPPLQSAPTNGKKFTGIATGVQSDSDILFVFSFDTFIHLSDIKKTAVHLTSLFLEIIPEQHDCLCPLCAHELQDNLSVRSMSPLLFNMNVSWQDFVFLLLAIQNSQ